MILKKLDYYSFIISFLLFFVLFIGNYEIEGFRVFYISILCFVFYLLGNKNALTWQTLLLVFTLSIFNFIIVNRSLDVSSYINNYFNWSIQMIISLLIIQAFIKNIIYNDNTKWFLLFVFLFLLFSVGVFLKGQNAGGRVHFIFGPNVLYRVVGFLAVISIYYTYCIKKNVLLSLTFLIVYFCIVVLIGSRGGLVSSLVLVLMLFHYHMGKVNYKLILLTTLFVLLSSLIVNYFLVDSRMVDFNVDNEASSVGIRYYVIMYTVKNIGGLLLSTGMDYSQYYSLFYTDSFMYPHNLFVELILFYGFWGALLSGFIIYCLVFVSSVFLKSQFGKGHVVYYFLLILFPGVLFSGDLNDNISVISLLFSVYILRKSMVD